MHNTHNQSYYKSCNNHSEFNDDDNETFKKNRFKANYRCWIECETTHELQRKLDIINLSGVLINQIIIKRFIHKRI